MQSKFCINFPKQGRSFQPRRRERTEGGQVAKQRKMISHKHRCIFVHIPKCGGTSIEDAIWPGPRTVKDLWAGYNRNPYQSGGLQHLCIEHIRKEVPDCFNDYWKFAFVRNPWDRVISQYLFTMRHRRDLRDILKLPNNASFELYLHHIVQHDNVQWKPQRPFIYENNRLTVDFVGRFEQFAEDAKSVLTRFGITTPVPHAKKSERGPYQDYYSLQTKQMVATIYREDIETFGYRFD
jgi:hypothetical protein